jgi:serine/threonine protein kinase
MPVHSGLRFRILRPHTRGGLGEVYLAIDEELNRQVALKQIQERHADDRESRERFLREAMITGALEHPGIVPVYGLGEYADGRPFYAMRFIRGETFRKAIDRFHQAAAGLGRVSQALEFRQLLNRFIAVCNAVAYAHSQGILHRDLKPENIMLGSYGETLVVDWGIAKSFQRSDGAETIQENDLELAPVTDSELTQAGRRLGTPQYMSPEQAVGRPDQLTPASDVYSLGATLYCLLTGKPPFAGLESDLIFMLAQEGDFPSPRKRNAAVPRTLEAICLKAMARRPEDRYASARDLADDLEHWLGDEAVLAYRRPCRSGSGAGPAGTRPGSASRPGAWPSRRPWPWLGRYWRRRSRGSCFSSIGPTAWKNSPPKNHGCKRRPKPAVGRRTASDAAPNTTSVWPVGTCTFHGSILPIGPGKKRIPLACADCSRTNAAISKTCSGSNGITSGACSTVVFSRSKAMLPLFWPWLSVPMASGWLAVRRIVRSISGTPRRDSCSIGRTPMEQPWPVLPSVPMAGCWPAALMTELSSSGA